MVVQGLAHAKTPSRITFSKNKNNKKSFLNCIFSFVSFDLVAWRCWLIFISILYFLFSLYLLSIYANKILSMLVWMIFSNFSFGVLGDVHKLRNTVLFVMFVIDLLPLPSVTLILAYWLSLTSRPNPLLLIV